LRSHDAAEVKARCRASIPALFEKLGLPAPQSVVQDEEGWVNPCFFVDETVVRFNARDPHEPKHHRERSAYALARDAGLPVPQVLALDESREAAPFSVLVTERLPGRSLEASWAEVPESRRDAVAEQSGRLLAALHEIELESFGELPGVDGQGPGTWRGWLTARCEAELEQAREEQVFDESERARYRALFEREAPGLEAVTSPRLVHRDYHFSNLLHVDGHLSAVLDFEWAIAGDPEADLLNANAIAQVEPRAADRWLAAYRELRPEREGAGRRRRLYQSLYNLTLSLVAARHFPVAEARAYKAVSLRRLEAFLAD